MVSVSLSIAKKKAVEKGVRIKVFCLLIAMTLFSLYSHSQSGLCDPNTPFFQVNLSGNANGTWVSNPPVQRQGNCCNTVAPDKCIEFEITLHPQAVAISFDIASGAIPPGAMFYQVNCGPMVPVGQNICVSGAGPHTITFCKPGNNQNTYQITSFAGPGVSPTDTTGDGCSATAYISGVYVDTSITWSEITSGTNAYLSYLNCTSGCDTVTITPQPGYPSFVDYVVCGKPSAGPCYPVPYFCDTIRVYFLDPIINTIMPDPATICANNPAGVTLTGTINGGLPPYTVSWTNGSGGTGTVVGSGTSFNATAVGNYSMIVYDGTYPECPPKISNVTVTQVPAPIVNAGSDQTVCATNPSVTLSGNVTNATGGTWSGGTGTFSPNNNSLFAVYTPSANEIAAGTVTLTLTSTGHGNCIPVSDQMVITIAPQINLSMQGQLICWGQTGTLTANPSGGIMPYSYSWSTGQTTQTISNLSPGTYTVTIRDAIQNGCSVTQTVNVTQNPEVIISAPSNHIVSCDSMVPITISASGGAGNFSYLWNTGATTTSISVPSGVYIITATDNAGCQGKDTIAIQAANSALSATINQPGIICYGTTTNLQVNPSGGFGNYTFLWNTNSTSQNITAGAGTYSVIVSDSAGCLTSASMTVNENPQLIVTIPVPQVICNGASTSVTAYPSGGTGPYTYQWSSGSTSSTITQTAGTYSVVITDSNNPGCTTSGSVTISQATPLTVSSSSTPATCFGGMNGSATAIPSGSVGPYSYYWAYNNSTSNTIYGISAGTYSAVVTDAIGCSASVTASVGQPPQLMATASTTTNVTCYGGNNGVASVSANGGTPGYQYSWSPSGGTGTTATGLIAGTYTINITDWQGCTATATTIVNQPPQLQLSANSVSAVSCYGGSDGSATVNASGGTPGYTYYWVTTGTSGATNSNLMNGTYFANVTDASGCVASTSITISQPTALQSAIASTTNVSCYNGTDGSASISATGGTPGYTFSWPGIGQTGNIASNLAAGTYNYTITDNNGCLVNGSVTINQPTLLVASGSSTPTTCFGGNDGTASVSGSGGSGGYTYFWSYNNSISTGISGLSPGNYQAVVTDMNGCAVTATINVGQPPQLIATANTTANVNCFGGANGSASVNVSGGTPSYQYSWLPFGGTNSTASGLQAGTYTVTITDANGCNTTSSATVIEPTQLSANISSSSNVSCFGGNNGSAQVSASGGTPGYSYFWTTTGTAGSSVSGLTAGSYSVTVTDAAGCGISQTVIITEPSALQSSVPVYTPASCFGGNDGTANLSASGGTPGYQYSWPSLGLNTSTVSNLSAGSYTYTITDTNGCSISGTVTITQPAQLTATGTATPATCFGGTNGTASVSATGGTGTYSYYWSFNNSVLSSQTGLTAASYQATVTDANGCISTTTINVGQAPDLVVVTSTTTNVTCNGGNNGAVSVSASGGTPGYQYLWSNGGTSSSISGLTAGSYSVTVTDNNGCSKTSTVTISQPVLLTATISSSNHVSCSGGNNGAAQAIAAGGTPGYNYLWTTTGTTGSSISGLTAGTYNLTVTDSSGCVASASVIINEPNSLQASVSNTTPVSCFGGNDGSSTIAATGGAGGYQYSWPSLGYTTATASNLTAGSYNYSITDSNGCVVSGTVNITQPIQLSASASGTSVSCFGASDGTATATASGGTGPYSFYWPANNSTSGSISNLAAGTYPVTVTDANGCISNLSVNITQPQKLQGLALTVNSVSCFGGNNGSASVSASGGTPGYQFSWSPYGGTGQTASGLMSGTYVVTISDANGCITYDTTVVNQPSQLAANISSGNHVSCYGGNNGNAVASATGGTPGYTFYWVSTGTSGPGATGLTSGIYNINVTDAAGCMTTTSVTINQPTPIQASTSSNNSVSCHGGNNGSVTVSATGGTPGYNFYWPSLGQSGGTVSNLTAGTYGYTVSDINGCSISGSVLVAEPSAMTFTSVSSSNATCFNSCDGSASVTATGGSGAFSYSWNSGQTSGIISGLCAGNYYLTITDTNSCVLDTLIIISQPTQITATSSSTVSYCGQPTGIASVTPSGGTPGYSYVWSTFPVQYGSTATGLVATNYTVTIMDSNNCVANIQVTVPGSPGVSAGISSFSNPICNATCTGIATVAPTGGNGPFFYNWNTTPAQSTPTASGLCQGTYIATIIDGNGCSDTAVVSITTPPPVQLTVVPNVSTICIGQPATLSASATGGSGVFTYTWSNNGTSFQGQTVSVTPNVTTTYNVVVMDNNGCLSGTETITVPVNPPLNALVAPGFSICQGGTANLTASASGGDGQFNFTWIPGSQQGNVITVSPTVTTTYTVQVNDGCGTPADTALITIIVHPKPVINFSASDTTGCAPFCVDFSGTSVATGDTIVNWLWDFGDNTTNGSQNSTHCFTESGDFDVSLTAMSGFGCTETFTFSDFVTVLPSPSAGFIFSPHSTVSTDGIIHFSEMAEGETTWWWDFGDGDDSTGINQPNPSHYFNDTGNYCITLYVKNQFNCVDSSVECLRVEPEFTFYVPNAFTPNGNGINDFFFGKGENISEFRMWIFDRWGNLIWEANSLDEKWDGRANGGDEIAQQDVYVWMVKLSDMHGNKHKYTGHVTLIK